MRARERGSRQSASAAAAVGAHKSRQLLPSDLPRATAPRSPTALGARWRLASGHRQHSRANEIIWPIKKVEKLQNQIVEMLSFLIRANANKNFADYKNKTA